MKKEIANSGKVITTQNSELQSAIIEIVKRTDIDPDRLEKFLDIQIKMEERQNKQGFQEALSRFQGECPIIKKRSDVKYGNTDYTFASLDEIVHTIKPYLLKNGLSFSFNMLPSEGMTDLITTVHHERGYSKDSHYLYDSLDDGGKMNSSQRRKSALTYAKRASLENALGLVSANEDDDANRAIDLPVTETGIKTITELMINTGTDSERFLKFMQVSSLKELSLLEAEKAVHVLKQKRVHNVQTSKL